MNLNSIFVVVIVGVTADVISAVTDQNALVEFLGKPFGDYTPGEARPYDKKVKHGLSRPAQRIAIGHWRGLPIP